MIRNGKNKIKFTTTKEKIVVRSFKSHNTPNVRIMTRPVEENDSNQQKQ